LFFLSFASWIQFLAVDHVYPEYNIWTQYVSGIALSTCMFIDEHISHPIEIKPMDRNKTTGFY
jgi:aminopeptidase 2